MNILRRIESGVRKVNHFLFQVGGGFILCVLVITMIDVPGRYFRHPLPGAFELCQVALLAMVFLTLAHTQAEKGHVKLDMLYNFFPPQARRLADVTTSLLGLLLAVLLAWAALAYTLNSRAGGQSTDELGIPIYIFQFLMFIGMLALSCQFILDLRDSYRQIERKHHGNST